MQGNSLELSSFQVKAPGSVMLMGEYSVLQNHPAIVSAINKHITLTWQTKISKQPFIKICGNNFRHSTDWLKLEKHDGLNFVINVIQFFISELSLAPEKIRPSVIIKIDSDMPSNVGLGTSASVTAATLLALNKFFKTNFCLEKLFAIGLKTIRHIQNDLGSGADLMASLHGGTIYFNPKNLSIKKLDLDLPISLIYVGYKTKTAQAIKMVQTNWQENKLSELYEQMATITKKAWSCLQKVEPNLSNHSLQESLIQFAEQMNEYQKFMQLLGIVDAKMQNCYELVCQSQTILGVKISGSGFGDCFVFTGKLEQYIRKKLENAGNQIIVIKIANAGTKLKQIVTT